MLAISYVLGAWNIKSSSHDTGRENDVRFLQPITADRNLIFACHEGSTVKVSYYRMLPFLDLGFGSTVKEFILVCLKGLLVNFRRSHDSPSNDMTRHGHRLSVARRIFFPLAAS